MEIEIWSDFICPWCYIGKRRFEAGLERFARKDEVKIVWRSFELDPAAPAEDPQTLDEMLAGKYNVSRDEARAMHEQVTALAAAEGLEYRFDIAKHGNTFNAHRLAHLAIEYGLQDEIEERLMAAYFTQGLPIGAPETLLSVGAGTGIPKNKIEEMLASEAYANEVRADEERARELGIRGVPFFLIGGKHRISGAQPADVFLEAFPVVGK